MRELELDGIHDDGEHVILLDSDGERYTLRIDEALRAAVRRDRPALGMIQASAAAPLRPKEIQSLLRAGRSAEDIAEVAQVPIDHVRRYEGPVLAEREWTADRARRFPVGRGGPGLDQVVAERLAARQAEADTAWDAWRRSDGTWTLELTFSAGGRTRQAHWQADLANRTVAPLDDEARWISDEDGPPEPARARTRLMAVKSSVYDVEADGAFDEHAPRPARGRGALTPTPQAGLPLQPGRANHQHQSAIDESELDALNARRGLRSVPPLGIGREDPAVWASLAEEDTPSGATDPQVSVGEAHGVNWAQRAGLGPGSREAAPGGPGGAAPDHADPAEDADREAEREYAHEELAPEDLTVMDAGSTEFDADPSLEDPAATGSKGTPAPQSPAEDGRTTGSRAGRPDVEYQDTVDLTPLPGLDPVPPENDDEQATRPAKKPARSKRSSIPSWDEIVFGSKHD